MRRSLSTMPRRFRDSRSWITASTTKAPLLCQRIPVAAFSRGAGVLGIATPAPKLNGFMRHLQRKRTPLATTGRFRRQNRPETPPSVGVSPGRRSRQQTTAAGNRTEVQSPWRNRRPFPAKPPRSRGAAPAGGRGIGKLLDFSQSRWEKSRSFLVPMRLF